MYFLNLFYSPLLCCWQDLHATLNVTKVRVIVAWGKNCREESDIVFAVGYSIRFVKELIGF